MFAVFTRAIMLTRVLAMALCLSVCLPQVGVLLKLLNEWGWFLAWELPSTYSTIFPPKLSVLSSGTSS